MPEEAVTLEEGETGRDPQAHHQLAELHIKRSGLGWLLSFIISIGRLLQSPALHSIKSVLLYS